MSARVSHQAHAYRHRTNGRAWFDYQCTEACQPVSTHVVGSRPTYRVAEPAPQPDKREKAGA